MTLFTNSVTVSAASDKNFSTEPLVSAMFLMYCCTCSTFSLRAETSSFSSERQRLISWSICESLSVT